MSANSENNKRIVKNSIFLYFRMILLMFISLYTSRIVLNTLGVSDYGIYNVVGGVVSLFSILSSSLSSAISRFQTFELGKKNFERLQLVFNTAVTVQCLMSIFVIVAAEIVGIWFLNTKMNIPINRLNAANWVMHCSILTFAINLISVPYNASIISHERMEAFAYISILEAIFKLAITFSLYFSPFDKLKSYAVLLLIVSIIIRQTYSIYCKKQFDECNYQFKFSKPLFKEMTSFAGWNFLGNLAYLLNTQGANILLNIFFGVGINAARGIAVQVNHTISNFVNSFMTAINPQITKSYAEDNLNYMHTLICRGAKYSFFVMLFFAIPIGLETPILLKLWLKIVPDSATIFVRLILISALCTILGNTLYTAQLATGNIKKYQISVSLFGSLVFPLTWLAFKLGAPPAAYYYIYILIYFLLIFIKIYLVQELIKMSWKYYIKEALIPAIFVALISCIPPIVIYIIQEESIWRFFEIIIISTISTVGTIYYLGLDFSERKLLINQIKKGLRKK